MGDLLGGFACWVKVLLLRATPRVLNRERQGGRESIAENAEGALANRWRRPVESAASFSRQQCLVFL